jgi:sirohydrochlorin cobaltochelatase
MKAVILVGHGGVPSDAPRELVAAAARHEPEADRKLRAWPRTPQTDPYKAGLEAIGAELRRASGKKVYLAYNEFCPPTLEEAIALAVKDGAKDIEVISTMYTRGGIHSEAEIPELLDKERRAHPGVAIHYAWPFDVSKIAGFLASHLK